MKNIVISNIYGPYNLGDYAIRDSAIRLLRSALPKSRFYLLSESVSTEEFINYNKEYNTKVSYAPYGFMIRSSDKISKPLLIKLYRFSYIAIMSFFLTLLGKISSKLMPTHGFFKYINWIKSADIVILMGGGWFVSKHPILDSFGLILDLLPIFIAKYYRKTILILPVSYGPFALKTHDFLVKLAISNTTVLCRDDISLKLAQKHNSKAIFISDLALYDWPKYMKKEHDNYYVLTVRDYLNYSSQTKVELEIANFIDYLWKNYKTKCIFIPTGANPIEENDLIVARRLKNALLYQKAFEIKLPKNPEEAKKIIEKAKFSLCTRMHSAIFSATVFTPFIALSYNHKVDGLLEKLNLKKWSIPFKSTSSKTLRNQYSNLFKGDNYKLFITTLIKARGEAVLDKSRLTQIIKSSVH